MKPSIKYALKQSQTVSIDIGATTDVVFEVPDDELWFIKSISISTDADVTVNSVTIDGKDTYITSTTDFKDTYGDFLIAHRKIVINTSNSAGAAAAENITVEIIGIQSEK